ncbi:MAG TPA: aminotransferase class I/II-fold pyridoxal phosphate-dependent enzyme, partial [Gaiellaceae bacterium]|nr:aminotransferase class I/II-fold pyridoxal phosphate-dependent enzyme [Gaiellaceae bacterium]
ERLAEVAREPTPLVHGYAPFSGLPALKEAIAARYRDVYGVALDPAREVAIVPGTKTALVELALCAAERGETIVLPDPGDPDYTSAVALAAAREERVPLGPAAGWAPDLEAIAAPAPAALYLNYPSNPCAACAPDGLFDDVVAWAAPRETLVVHDFAYGDLVFDGRVPASFLAAEGAREVGVELFSMSKSYGMAGWRLGFVLGNAEVVARVELLQDHVRAGIFRAIQEAGIAALTGPQDTVEERRALYERRRDRVLAALGSLVPEIRCDGSFYVWLQLPPGATADGILAERRVALAPGEGFGPSGAGWARISLATADDVLDAGLARLADAFRA